MAMLPSSQSDLQSQGSAYGSDDANIKSSKVWDARQNPSGGFLDQVLSAHRMQAAQNLNMLRMGGPQYLDYLDQLRTNPMMTFY